tara:strand:- start:191 stop:583 length:393 start_codon:yes stop_codon:yes gene_type:complete
MKITNSNKELRSFGIIVGFFFPFLIGFILPLIMGHQFKSWTLLVGIPLLFLALISPKKLKIPYKLWMRIGNILGFINSRIILGLIFIIVMQPIALIMKIVGYDPLKQKWNNSKSYREYRKNDIFDLNKIF